MVKSPLLLGKSGRLPLSQVVNLHASAGRVDRPAGYLAAANAAARLSQKCETGQVRRGAMVKRLGNDLQDGENNGKQDMAVVESYGLWMFMVIRYNELVRGGYKPTNITGGTILYT